jgi:lipocalin
MYLFLFLIQSLFLFAKSNNFTTVSELDLPKYMGHWYQVYAAPVDYVFQGYGKCITADYQITGSNNVSVLNAQYNINNEYEEIKGYAFYKDVNQPGKLSVVLDGVGVVAPYWVIKLGEIVNSYYQYSIISVPEGPSLWVIARNTDDFFNLYDEDVKTFLDENKLTYIKVVQNC